MRRLFIGLSVPNPVADHLMMLQAGLPGARWRPRENFHLTLRFIGEVDPHAHRDIASNLNMIRADGFELEIAGCGQFGDRRPRAVWAGVRANPALAHLQSKIEIAVQRAGFAPEQRRFTPHVTLAYLRGARAEQVAAFVANCSGFQAAPFIVDAFHLYESRMGGESSHYEILADYPLAALNPSNSP